VGQELAVRQLSDAVCDYLAQPQAIRPLILSAHGPPGVGKSLSHLLLARALYKKQPSDKMKCPGSDCPGYKVWLTIH
jgi:DNA polymerase III delta prime subunit